MFFGVLIFTVVLGGKCCHGPHFTAEEIQAQRKDGASAGAHRESLAEQDPRLSDSPLPPSRREGAARWECVNSPRDLLSKTLETFLELGSVSLFVLCGLLPLLSLAINIPTQSQRTVSLPQGHGGDRLMSYERVPGWGWDLGWDYWVEAESV